MIGEVEKAREDIDLSITLDPYNAWAYRNKGLYNLMKGNTAEAIRLLKRVEEMDPFVEYLYLYLGKAYYDAGDKRNACAAYGKSFTVNTNLFLAFPESSCNRIFFLFRFSTRQANLTTMRTNVLLALDQWKPY